MNKNILVTGAAGFIGFHLCKKLIAHGIKIIGIDNINDYYDIELKKKRLEILSQTSSKNNWQFNQTDLLDKDQLLQLFQDHKPETVINLAAQAGVRYSIENPRAYINANILGFQNILDCCKEIRVKHLLYASSSYSLTSCQMRCACI